MLKTSVKGQQKVAAALKKHLKKYEGDQSVLIGIRGEAGAHDKSEITLATLGAIHEFGNDRIPARPFLVPGVQEAQPKIIEIFSSRLARDGVDKTLGLVGAIAKYSVRHYMVNLRSPSNAASTVRAKKSSNPLIDTGQLLGSVTYIVTSENIEEGI